MAAPAPDFSAQERQISAALIAAQQTAETIVNDANENAERIRNEADAKAREVIRQALTEKQAELEEIDRLKASREEFKAEYLKLIQHFMDDAQNSFPADLMASTPVGSAASPAVTVPAEPLPVADPVVPVPIPSPDRQLCRRRPGLASELQSSVLKRSSHLRAPFLWLYTGWETKRRALHAIGQNSAKGAW